MHRTLALGCLALVSFARVATADIPGFEDKNVLDKVLGGQFVIQDVTNTKKEFRSVFRLYVPKREAEAWVGVATDHAKYPDMISAVKSAKTTKVSADKSEYEYALDILVKVGPFSQHIYPEGRQLVKRGADATAETSIVNTITNYQDMIASNTETTRLIPYEGGFLVHDDVHFVLQKENSQSSLIQRELKKNAQQILEGFRSALTR